MADHDPAMAAPDDTAGLHAGVGREMVSDAAACGGAMVSCANLDDINQAERLKQPEPDSGLAWLAPVSVVDCLHAVDRAPPLSFSPGDAARLTGAFPPLNVLYCVYLD